jgi:hypothetical protein
MSKLYGAYRFTTKDPEIDNVRTMFEDHFGRRVNNKDLVVVKESGGPTTSAMTAWFFGKTRRPQNATLEAAGRAIGFRRVWQKMK